MKVMLEQYEKWALEAARPDPDKGLGSNLALAQIYATLAVAAAQDAILKKLELGVSRLP